MIRKDGKVTLGKPSNPAQARQPSDMEELWQVVGASTHGQTLKHLMSGKYLSLKSTQPTARMKSDPIWALQPIVVARAPESTAEECATLPGYFRLLDRKSAFALNNETGALSVSAYQPGWWSAQWVVTEQNTGEGRLVTLKNRWTAEHLMIRNDQVVLGRPANPATIRQRSDMEQLWRIVGTPGHGQTLQHLKSGRYLSWTNGKPESRTSGAGTWALVSTE